MRGLTCIKPDIYIELGDFEYQPHVAKYYPASPQTRDDPGDGSEVDISNIVTLHNGPHEIGHTTWGILVLEYAYRNRLALDKAEQALYEMVLQAADEAADDYEPDYEDGRDWADRHYPEDFCDND